MKKAMLGFIATAMSLLATTAQAGDIRSIDPCDQYGYVIPNGSMAQPYTAGQTAYFRIRLENLNSCESWETKDTTMLSNPWRFQYTGVGVDSALEWAINPPKVGVYVSGQLRGATIISALPPADKGWYTDILCSYTVRPGDLALPMTLANQAGKEMGDGSATEYYLDTIPRSGAWRLIAYERESASTWNTVISTNTCTFKYGETGFFNSNASAASEMNDWTTDYALKQAGLYLKSVDFTATEYSVAQGRTEKVSVGIVGGVNTNGNGTVYAMVKDGVSVALAEDSIETIPFEVIENGGATTNTYDYQVAKVTIPYGEDVSSFTFKVKGVYEATVAETVYLSTTKGFSYGPSGDLITNFVTTAVKCVAPPPPYIAVTLDGAASKSVVSSSNYADYAAKLTVTLSEAHTSDVTVDVTPTLVSGAAVAPLDKYIGMSTHSDNGFLEKVSTVTFSAAEMAAGKLSKDLYIYVLGADDQTDGLGKGILFKPADVAIYNNENVPAILYIKKSTPQILYPTENYAISGLNGGVSSAFTIKITDDYTNMQSPFKVEWYKTGSGTPQTFTVTPNSDGEATVSVRYNAGNYTTRFRVQNASGVWSDLRTINVQVNPAKQVMATVTDPADMNEYDEKTREVSVKFLLTEAYEDDTLYAFLLPQDAASSNLVVCKNFNQGIPIRSGDTNSTGVAKIEFLDGTDLSLPLTYSIILRTERTLDAGEEIATYESKDFELWVHNTPPEVIGVNMSGSAPLTVNGGTFRGKASIGLNKIFTLEADDLEIDLTNNVTSVWTFSDPNGYATTHTVTAPLDDIVLTNVFEVAGTYTCSVKLQDKDMTSRQFGQEFAFNVEVLATPSVQFRFPNSNTFNETEAEKGTSYFWVGLSTPATVPVEIDINCTRVGADGVLNLVTNKVSLRAGQTETLVTISELDGTLDSSRFAGGFLVTASVVTETKNEDGMALKDVYIPAEEKFYVVNEAPVIVVPLAAEGTNDAPVDTIIPIKWKISDVNVDLTNNLTVAWKTSEKIEEIQYVGSDVFEGVFTNKFTSSGTQWVQITVTDKDSGISEVRRLYYRIAPSKSVMVFPYGPKPRTAVASIVDGNADYLSAEGLGAGRVWADSASVSIADFNHTYTYGELAKNASIFAWGYNSGDVDKGQLTPGRDHAIDMSGNKVDGIDATSYYTYEDLKDSFFYAWLVGVKDDTGAFATLRKMVVPMKGKGYAQYSLSLPMEQVGDSEKTNPDFPDTEVAAFFAKELRLADNMGDMNTDGIPDWYATRGWATGAGNSMTIAQFTADSSSSGSDSEGGDGAKVSFSDLTKVDSYNHDEDYLPKHAAYGNYDFSPDPDHPFTAVMEIRGLEGKESGLNELGISEYDLSEAETYALLADFAAAGNAISGTNDVDYANATNWATSVQWTPEAVDELGNRLNPISGDTDGDGFDDGWEYYFWYNAKIGSVVGGKWSRLEGRRFDPTSPKLYTRISSAEIVAAFDPHRYRYGGDTDNDGLTDFEEYILGTNPVCCDTMGDGVLDSYKVLNGLLERLVKLEVEEDPDNPDADFMARCEYAEDTFTVYTFENGEMLALPSATGSAATLADLGKTNTVVKVEFANGEIGWFLEVPATIKALNSKSLMLASDVSGYASFEYDGNNYLGAKKVFVAGAVVKSVDATPVDLIQAAVTEFAWTNPETLSSDVTKKALPLFNYGADGVTYVPCVTNVTTYSAIPADVALVKVEEERKVTLIHNQVLCQYGFDPRTAWNIDEYGYLSSRWRKDESAAADGYGAAGKPVNTEAYTTRDEYFVMQYRQQMRAIDKNGKRSDTESMLTNDSGSNGDVYLVKSLKDATADTLLAYLQSATTYPNLPVSFIRDAYSVRNEVSPFANSTNKTIIAYWAYLEAEHDVHGADTDFDGIPDGWELYVKGDPTYTDDGKARDGWAEDDDKLSMLEEFAGVDSCNAYTNRFDLADPSKLIYPEATTITKHHPGKDKGWWNKFFPTNPFDKDTDGDGLPDDIEGKNWKDEFFVGCSPKYQGVSFTFIYGEIDTDNDATCFRGGGLNPCTVDTDGDLLPDGWERQFAGIVFEGGATKAVKGLSANDLAVLIAADGKQNALTNTGVCIRGGMDGTFKNDANYDFDHDGLANFQEYLVQSLRHLRYDDQFTPLMGVDPTTKKFVRFIPFSAWDGEAFHKRCKEAGFTGLKSWSFRELGYFTLPPYEWDMLRQNTKGMSACKNYADYEGAGYRVMLPPVGYTKDGPATFWVNDQRRYVSTDPRRVDSDCDGMDDYWELFHGLNPLLGSYERPTDSGEYGWLNSQYDVIAQAYADALMTAGTPESKINAWHNFWTGWNNDERPALDPVLHPWMMGVMEADADGDGLRNDEEALKVNLAKPRNTHTDPTPLWMTDSSGSASYTAQYYSPDPYITGYTGSVLDIYPDLFMYPWADISATERLAADGMGGASLNWMFAFEENEGFDTDHDFRRDATELTKGVEMTSDPKNHTDLHRRQALYFPGWNSTDGYGSAAVSYGGEFRRSPSTEPDMLKQFTVECWVKPEVAQKDVTILERVCDYGASTLIYGTNVIRANFRIGINKDGCVYGEFQGTTADSGAVNVASRNPIEIGKWTHLAFRYDGDTASLHVNGELTPVATFTGAGLLPANGILGIQQTPSDPVISHTGYRALPCATVLGASIIHTDGFSLSEKTVWGNYNKFYKGWIDEVRIWDGARTASEIQDSYQVAFSMDDIKQMRSNAGENGIFDKWSDGYTRSGKDGKQLQAELLQHYNFSTLPGGVERDNVITEPTGFRAGVLNNVRKPNGGSLDLHTLVGWWSKTEVHSEVYSDYHVVPWIPNTVAHLPFMDGSAPDSQFWSTGIAGLETAADMGITAYEFPNEANPYPYYFYHRDRYNRLNLLRAVEGIVESNAVEQIGGDLSKKWLFDLRSGFVGTSDLLPLGGAFAKRDVEFWDNQGPMDAWTDTKGSAFEAADSDGDGIPNWAEKLDSVTNRDDYLRKLAAGLLPDGTIHSNYESIVDANFDGVPDWWQKFNGLADSAREDTDKDGLADFMEYLVTERFFKYIQLDVNNQKSDSREFDYFRKPADDAKVYLGELFSDHDFMEDHLEKDYAEIGASATYYDAHLDSDDDGWSNWAEVRAKQYMGLGWRPTGSTQTNTIYNTYSDYKDYQEVMAKVIGDPTLFNLLDASFTITGYASYSDSYYGTGFIKYHMYTPVYGVTHLYEGTPTPDIEMTVHYNGIVDLSGVKLEVKSYSGTDLSRHDALFHVQNGDARHVNTLSFRYPVEGALREGMNTFVVSIAATNNAAGSANYSMMGVARNVDVGWSKVKFEVELTETTPICQRTTIPAGSTNDMGKVYVYRYSIDDVVTPPSSLDYGPVVVKDLGFRASMHEGDFLSADDFDLDWSEFRAKVLNNSTVRAAELPVNKVVYRVYRKEVDLEREVEKSYTNKMPFVEIVREFGANRATAVPVAPGEDSTIYYGGQPTFRWTVEGERPDTYTAFAIKVMDASGEVWNSGTQMLPPKNSKGEYVWTAPLYAGDQTSLGKVFGSCANYKWSVIMYNSKFQSNETKDWSAARTFRVNIYGEDEPNNSGYYTLDVDVKYFGPGTFNADVGAVKGKIRIEAFTSPDFSGVPAARTFITNLASVTASEHVRNVRIAGLAAGTYYVRAYIDSDGDFKRSNWESWGYSSARGDRDTGDIFKPTGFTLGDGKATPLATLYIEDTDVDQDALPDVWEYDEWSKDNAGLTIEDFLLKEGVVENNANGYIAVANADKINKVVAANYAGGMLSLAASGYMPSAMAAMMLGVDSVEPEIEEGTLGITAFSLDGDTVKLTVGAKADDPLAGSVFVSNGKITATVVVLHATSLAEGFAELKSVDVTFDIEEGAVSHTERISLKDILGDDVDLSKGFFKVELK